MGWTQQTSVVGSKVRGEIDVSVLRSIKKQITNCGLLTLHAIQETIIIVPKMSRKYKLLQKNQQFVDDQLEFGTTRHSSDNAEFQ